jgi:hypothetical protein
VQTRRIYPTAHIGREPVWWRIGVGAHCSSPDPEQGFWRNQVENDIRLFECWSGHERANGNLFSRECDGCGNSWSIRSPLIVISLGGAK